MGCEGWESQGPHVRRQEAGSRLCVQICVHRRAPKHNYCAYYNKSMTLNTWIQHKIDLFSGLKQFQTFSFSGINSNFKSSDYVLLIKNTGHD